MNSPEERSREKKPPLLYNVARWIWHLMPLKWRVSITRLGFSHPLSVALSRRTPQKMLEKFRRSANSDHARGYEAHVQRVRKTLPDAKYEMPEPPDRREGAPQVIAYYLPQFHPIEENNEWWEPGFTEWTMVSRALPQFVGHRQPRLPGELGYYDLRLPQVMERQIEMALTHGISAFCFYYYWFNSNRLLEKPLEAFLSRKDAAFDMPFMLCWANENWTRRWDGDEREILIAQKHSAEDDAKIIADLIRYFRDPRYLQFDGRPVLQVYRPAAMPDFEATVRRWRKAVKDAGFSDLYLIVTDAFHYTPPRDSFFNALSRFPPHSVSLPNVSHELTFINQKHQGAVYDYEVFVEAECENLKMQKPDDAHQYFPGVMTGWDNEPRRRGAGSIFIGSNPATYGKWLSQALNDCRRLNPSDERIVFINAWNEWGEGAYLEPDRDHGYEFLKQTRISICHDGTNA